MERGRRVLKEAKPGARKVETTMSYLCDEDANIFVTRINECANFDYACDDNCANDDEGDDNNYPPCPLVG